jgi:hypothetical protein
VLEQNRRYYARYPGDRERAREIAEHLSENEVELPGGGTLSPRRFQQLGIKFGGRNGFELVHYLLETAFVQGARGPELSFPFLREVEENGGFETNPIYALLHEPIYCEGAASDWSAQRVRAEFPEFALGEGQPVLFTGEMVYPWMFDEYVHLRPVKEAAEILASFDGWPALYDRERLAQNTVPCVAAVYYDDMYVERRFSEEAAELINATRIWLTNAYDHSGLRRDGEVVLDRLLRMLHGEA